MLMSELITILEKAVDEEGDQQCTTNGEFGESIALEWNHVSLGISELLLDDLPPSIPKRTVVCHIGGY
jgi:hypothetical protein